MKTRTFSKKVAKQVFDTLQEETSCWKDVRVELAEGGTIFANIRVTQDGGRIGQSIIKEVIETCYCFEKVYGWGICNCSFEVEDGKPVCNVCVRIKK